jgi:hypothetical protein
MIFVVAHIENGEERITVEYGDEFNTEHYEDIQKIFLCDNEDEAEIVIDALKRWGAQYE